MKLLRKIGACAGFLCLAATFQFCGTAKNTSQMKPAENAVSYDLQIQPLIVQSCTPCHFPEQGKKKFLDTYASAKANIQDIIQRVELPEDDPKFMPFKNKKPSLTEAQVQLLKDWVDQGFPK